MCIRDRFHLLLKEKQTAIYSVEIWKRFRKWGGIPTVSYTHLDVYKRQVYDMALDGWGCMRIAKQLMDDKIRFQF